MPQIDRRRALGALAAAAAEPSAAGALLTPSSLHLPKAQLEGAVPLERTIKGRRSVRDFDRSPLALAELSQLLWSAQGVTDPSGKRSAPSAGALYPLSIRVATGAVAGLEPGAWRYDAPAHALVRTATQDLRPHLAAAAGQAWLVQAPAIVLIAADPSRTMARYGARSARFVAIEAGHAAQNLQLQAVALGLGSTDVGAFDEARVKVLFGLGPREDTLLLLPVGRRRT